MAVKADWIAPPRSASRKDGSAQKNSARESAGDIL
jgi:hypothetical protein